MGGRNTPASTGWRCQHVSLSGSLRSITTQDAQFAQTSFVARQDLDAFQPVDRDTRRVIDMWVKILSRVSASPIHPAAEERIAVSGGDLGLVTFARPPTSEIWLRDCKSSAPRS